MAILDFKEIPQANKGGGKQDAFELFAQDFLETAGFYIIESPSRGADGKKDMIVEEIRSGLEGRSYFRWLVSAKHYAHSGKSVYDTDELDIRDRLERHGCDGFLGFYSTIPSSSLAGKLEDLQKQKKLEYSIYNWSKIEDRLISDPKKWRSILLRHFSKSGGKFLSSMQMEEAQLRQKQKPLISIPREDLISACKEAIILIEIEKLKYKCPAQDWEKCEAVLNELFQYENIYSYEVSREVYFFLTSVASRTRGGMTSKTASTIESLALNYFIRPDNEEEKPQSIQLAKTCNRIAFDLIYDACLYNENLRIAAHGYNLLKYSYNNSRRMNSEELMKDVADKYEELEQIFTRREGQDLSLALELMQVFKDDIHTGTLAWPPMQGELEKLVFRKYSH